jgi:hypothetical protein
MATGSVSTQIKHSGVHPEKHRKISQSTQKSALDCRCNEKYILTIGDWTRLCGGTIETISCNPIKTVGENPNLHDRVQSNIRSDNIRHLAQQDDVVPATGIEEDKSGNKSTGNNNDNKYWLCETRCTRTMVWGGSILVCALLSAGLLVAAVTSDDKALQKIGYIFGGTFGLITILQFISIMIYVTGGYIHHTGQIGDSNNVPTKDMDPTLVSKTQNLQEIVVLNI